MSFSFCRRFRQRGHVSAEPDLSNLFSTLVEPTRRQLETRLQLATISAGVAGGLNSSQIGENCMERFVSRLGNRCDTCVTLGGSWSRRHHNARPEVGGHFVARTRMSWLFSIVWWRHAWVRCVPFCVVRQCCDVDRPIDCGGVLAPSPRV